MTSASRATEVLQATGITRNYVSNGPGSITDKDVRSEEYVEVVDRSDNEPGIKKDVETAEDTQLPIQDGGIRAWLQVLGSFLVFSNIWGISLAYGILDIALV